MTSWRNYEAGLRKRGDLTIWFSQEVIKAWKPAPTGQRGAPRRYSDLVIKTALSLRLIFHLPRRQIEGFVASLLRLLDLELAAPDHTTLCRRQKDIKIPPLFSDSAEPLHLIVDSTGLKIGGAGEWSITRYGQKRRCWRKLHLGVNAQGEIIAQVLTDSETDGSRALPDLLEQVQTPISRFTSDGSYDCRPVNQAVGQAGAPDLVMVIPPSRRATISEEPWIRTWKQRNAAVTRISESNRRDRQRDSCYQQQARVENTFLRFKHILGPRLRSRSRSSQEC